jgi:hypothetical protein
MGIAEARAIAKVDKDKFLSKVNIPLFGNGCWIWTGALAIGGYGRFQSYKERHLTHRISYFIFKGKLDTSLVIDHTCRNRLCCNPDHLRQVDIKTNTLENSIGPASINKAKEFCDNGHEYNEKNTLFDPKKTRRYCRLCKKEANRKFRLKMKSTGV